MSKLKQYLELGRQVEQWPTEVTQALIAGRFVTFVDPNGAQNNHGYHVANEDERRSLAARFGIRPEDIADSSRVIVMRNDPVIAPSAATPPSPLGPFIIPVTYKTPTFEELDAVFDWVDPAYRGIQFKPIKACRRVSRTPRDIRVEYVHPGEDVTDQEALVAIRDQGLRPLIYEEGIALGHHRPDDQRNWSLPILGSRARVRGMPLVAVLSRLWRGDRGHGRRLDLGPVSVGRGAHCRFPGVRE